MSLEMEVLERELDMRWDIPSAQLLSYSLEAGADPHYWAEAVKESGPSWLYSLLTLPTPLGPRSRHCGSGA